MVEKSKKAAKPVKKADAPAAEAASKAVRRPITVVKRSAPKLAPKKPDDAPAFQNKNMDQAFEFAEKMKKRQREQDERRQQEDSAIKLSRRPTTRSKGKNTLQFPASDLAEFRKRLILLRQEALGQSVSLKANALEQSDERGSEDEDGSDSFMRLQSLGQVDSRNKVIQQIDEALHSIEDGTYGICEVCGQLIRKPRLANLPFVHTCMECQSLREGRR
ncbi:MAG: TraR/DksA family transcriptional regulator [Kiritimatiellia bacterium]